MRTTPAAKMCILLRIIRGRVQAHAPSTWIASEWACGQQDAGHWSMHSFGA